MIISDVRQQSLVYQAALTRHLHFLLWELKDDPFYQTVLMLIYNGCRLSELLDLEKKNVHLEEQYFDVILSKTENGIRKVPIADKVLPFYKTLSF